jgi:hypothetical protein
MGAAGGVAGSPLAQTQGSDVDRTSQESDAQVRRAQANQKAERAEGIGQTEEDHEAADRDADGRRPWELGGQPDEETAGDQRNQPPSEADPAVSRDATGQRGKQLDLSG